MRRTALAMAVLITVLAVAPAGGAQCSPTCAEQVRDAADDAEGASDDVQVDIPADGVGYQSTSTGFTLP